MGKRKHAVLTEEQADGGHCQSTVKQMLLDGMFESKNEDRTPAHRCILSCASPVFRVMFLEQTDGLVKVEDMSTGAFRAFLRLLYIGSLNRDDIQTFGLEVLAACHKYEVPRLSKICIPVLGDMLTADNAINILEHAKLYDESLFERCKEFICCNMKQMVSGPGFEDFAIRKPLLLVDLLRSDKLDGGTKELRISFRGFSTTTSCRHYILRMPIEGTVADVIAELRSNWSLPANRSLQILGVDGHTIIVKIYTAKDKITDLLEDLKVKEVRQYKTNSTFKTLRILHMLPDQTGLFLSSFDEPFTMRVANDGFQLWQLKAMISTYQIGTALENFRFARRTTLDPRHPTQITSMI